MTYIGICYVTLIIPYVSHVLCFVHEHICNLMHGFCTLLDMLEPSCPALQRKQKALCTCTCAGKQDSSRINEFFPKIGQCIQRGCLPSTPLEDRRSGLPCQAHSKSEKAITNTTVFLCRHMSTFQFIERYVLILDHIYTTTLIPSEPHMRIYGKP